MVKIIEQTWEIWVIKQASTPKGIWLLKIGWKIAISCETKLSRKQKIEIYLQLTEWF